MDWRMLLFYYEDTQRVFTLCQRSPQIIPKTHQNLSCKVLLLLCFLFGFCSFERKVIPKSLKDFASGGRGGSSRISRTWKKVVARSCPQKGP